MVSNWHGAVDDDESGSEDEGVPETSLKDTARLAPFVAELYGRGRWVQYFMSSALLQALCSSFSLLMLYPLSLLFRVFQLRQRNTSAAAGDTELKSVVGKEYRQLERERATESEMRQFIDYYWDGDMKRSWSTFAWIAALCIVDKDLFHHMWTGQRRLFTVALVYSTAFTHLLVFSSFTWGIVWRTTDPTWFKLASACRFDAWPPDTLFIMSMILLCYLYLTLAFDFALMSVPLLNNVLKDRGIRDRVNRELMTVDKVKEQHGQSSRAGSTISSVLPQPSWKNAQDRPSSTLSTTTTDGAHASASAQPSTSSLEPVDGSGAPPVIGSSGALRQQAAHGRALLASGTFRNSASRNSRPGSSLRWSSSSRPLSFESVSSSSFAPLLDEDSEESVLSESRRLRSASLSAVNVESDFDIDAFSSPFLQTEAEIETSLLNSPFPTGSSDSKIIMGARILNLTDMDVGAGGPVMHRCVQRIFNAPTLLFLTLCLVCAVLIAGGPWLARPLVYHLRNSTESANPTSCVRMPMQPLALSVLISVAYYASSALVLVLFACTAWSLIIKFNELYLRMSRLLGLMTMATGPVRFLYRPRVDDDPPPPNLYDPATGAITIEKLMRPVPFNWRRPAEQIRLVLHYRFLAAPFAEAGARLSSLLLLLFVYVTGFSIFLIVTATAKTTSLLNTAVMSAVFTTVGTIVIMLVMTFVVLIRAMRTNEVTRRQLNTLRWLRRALRVDRMLCTGTRWTSRCTVRLLIYTLATLDSHPLRLNILTMTVSAKSVTAFFISLCAAFLVPLIVSAARLATHT